MGIEGIEKSIKNVYGWKTENGEPVLEMDLPYFVKERIDYFRDETENGMTFSGYMRAVLAYDEKEIENQFNFFSGIDWLSPSEKFKKWRDEYPNMRQVEVAVAIIYGGYERDSKEDNHETN